MTSAPATEAAVTTVTGPSWRELTPCASVEIPPSPCRDGKNVIVAQGSRGYASIPGPAWEKARDAGNSPDPPGMD